MLLLVNNDLRKDISCQRIMQKHKTQTIDSYFLNDNSKINFMFILFVALNFYIAVRLFTLLVLFDFKQ